MISFSQLSQGTRRKFPASSVSEARQKEKRWEVLPLPVPGPGSPPLLSPPPLPPGGTLETERGVSESGQRRSGAQGTVPLGGTYGGSS